MAIPSSASSTPSGIPGTGCDNCGDLGLRIDHNGVWLYHGSPILRKEMVCLFASMLQRAEDGRFWLVSADEQGTLQVDDVPFLVVEMSVSGEGRHQNLCFRTNVDEWVCLDQTHPLRLGLCPVSGEMVPYVLVRPGLEARLNRPVYYDLVALADQQTAPDAEIFGLWSAGTFFPLGQMDQIT